MNSSKMIREDPIDSSEFEGISLNDKTEHHKRRSKPKGHHFQYICAICGDKALGYNFNAVTCESCKAFFRRNALRKKNMRCAFTGECALTPFTRKFCPACRLNKCINVGMKKQWILTEDQLQKRRVKIEHKRKTSREKNDESSHGGSNIFSPRVSRFERTPPSYIYNYGKLNDQIYPIPNNPSMISAIQRHHSFPTGVPPQMHKGSFSLDMSSAYFHPPTGLPVYSHCYPLAKIHKDSGFYDFIFTEEFEGDYLKSSEDFASHLIIKFSPQLPVISNNGGIFDTTPKMCLSEEANQMIENINYIFSRVFTNTDNLSTKTRQFAQFIRHFEEYRNLCQEDRLTLLKSSIIVLLTIRMSIVADVHEVNENESTIPPIFYHEESINGIEQLIQQCNATKELTEHSAGDLKTLQLMILIAIFSPEREDLNNVSLVVKTQEHYTYLLSLYLQSNYSRFQARTMFINLINDLQLIKIRAMNGVHVMASSNNGALAYLHHELSEVNLSST